MDERISAWSSAKRRLTRLMPWVLTIGTFAFLFSSTSPTEIFAEVEHGDVTWLLPLAAWVTIQGLLVAALADRWVIAAAPFRLALALSLHEHMDTPGQRVDFSLLARDHVAEFIHGAQQVGKFFFQVLHDRPSLFHLAFTVVACLFQRRDLRRLAPVVPLG